VLHAQSLEVGAQFCAELLSLSLHLLPVALEGHNHLLGNVICLLVFVVVFVEVVLQLIKFYYFNFDMANHLHSPLCLEYFLVINSDPKLLMIRVDRACRKS